MHAWDTSSVSSARCGLMTLAKELLLLWNTIEQYQCVLSRTLGKTCVLTLRLILTCRSQAHHFASDHVLQDFCLASFESMFATLPLRFWALHQQCLGFLFWTISSEWGARSFQNMWSFSHMLSHESWLTGPTLFGPLTWLARSRYIQTYTAVFDDGSQLVNFWFYDLKYANQCTWFQPAVIH